MDRVAMQASRAFHAADETAHREFFKFIFCQSDQFRQGGLMEISNPDRSVRWIRLLAAILVLATLTRLYDIRGPLIDQMYVKQVYVANKARNIAQPPLTPLRNALDFLDPHGERMKLTEEVPL